MRTGAKWGVAAGLVVLLALAAGALSVWPSVLIIRWIFDLGGVRANAALAHRVPAGVASRLNESYDAQDPDAHLDVFYPQAVAARGASLLTVVWIHGGGFVSGSKEQVANYARILAAGGFTVAAVDYSLAPGSTYPTPLRQLNRALGYLTRNAGRLHVDARHLVIAGDSAGAQLGAQLANLVVSSGYARMVGVAPEIEPGQLAGVVLYCGPYAMRSMRDNSWFSRTVMRAYSGERQPQRHPLAGTLDLLDLLAPHFPPAFLSVGNADPLDPQSRQLAAALTDRGARVETVFFAPDYRPPLPHEYQFDLDLAEAREALRRSQEFLRTLQ